MFYGILVATKSSDQSGHAPERAAMLAAASTTARLDVFSVIPPKGERRLVSWMRRKSVHEERSLQQQTMHRLAQQSSQLQRLFGVHCTVASGIGPLDMQTMARVRATRPDLIVVAEDADWFCESHGTHAAAMTARISGRPVLVVRSAPRGQYTRVGITVDFSHASARTLRTVMRLLPKAQLTYLQVSGADLAPDGAEAGGQGSANAGFPVFADLIDAGKAAIPAPRPAGTAPTSSHAAHAEPDLVVLNDRQESLLTRLLQRKPSARLGKISLSDILVVPTLEAGVPA
ncbi:universal stress protein [Massilia sp. GCM10023247]|uniref:universal stress protein n=1 Tax=Massilia sp. GCM10023247 TaxID=3252643 RepID=UPI0036170ABB